MKYGAEDRCSYCKHWMGDDEEPGVYISMARFKWLCSAAKQLMEVQGDDEWVDWRDEGKRLDKKERE